MDAARATTRKATAAGVGGALALAAVLGLRRAPGAGRGRVARASAPRAAATARRREGASGGPAAGRIHEIRIHGVSGTPPAAMLFRDGDGQVSRTRSYTDSLTGFFRDAAEDAGAPVRVEAYSWGGLTSSGGQLLERIKRIGWLLLIPFALVNVAYWARPDIDQVAQRAGTVSRRATAIAVRWAALLLTMVAIAAVCLVSMDLLAWQCFRGGSRVCALPGWVPAGALDLLGRTGWNAPAQRLATAAVLPLVSILVLFGLSLQSRSRYEKVASDDPVGGCGDHRDHWGLAASQDGDILLRRRRMWLGSHRIGRQQLNHLAVAVAVVVANLSLPILSAVATLPAGWWLRLAAAGAALAALCAFASAAFSVRDGNEFCGVASGRRDTAAKWLARSGAVLASGALAGALYLDHFRLDVAPVDQGRDFLADVPWVGMDAGLLLSVPFVLLAALVLFLMFASRSRAAAAAVVVLLIAVVGLAFASSARGDGLSGSTWLAVFVAIALTVTVVGAAHRRVGGVELQAGRAWRGAGPAVVLGGGIWIGLLFTTSLLVGTAGLLNGEQPVSAIAASYPSASSPTASILVHGQPPTALRAAGPVTVTDAVVVADSVSGLVVARGTVGVDQLWTDAREVSQQLPGLVAGAGALAIDSRTTELQVTNSCLTTGGTPAGELEPADRCTGTTTDDVSFVGRGSLPLDADATPPLSLGEGVQIVVADPPQETLVLPVAVMWAVTLLPLWTVLVLVGMWLARRRFGRVEQTIRDQTERDAADPGGIEPDDVPRCARGRFDAAFAHRAERLASIAAAVTAVVFLVLIAGSATGGLPWDVWSGLRMAGDAGLYLSLGLSLALVWVASQVRKTDSARRQAGIVWDIATFLPRVAHPLGPPSYGERVVPEVTRRVRTLLDQPAGHVVILSGHSQGSVIATAVAARLRDDQLQRIRLVTYGSQLRAWFGRIFPAVLGPAQLGTGPLPDSWGFDRAQPDAYPVSARAGACAPPPGRTLAGKLGPSHWVNLFRRSDPIGFRVFSDHDSNPSPAVAPLCPRDVYVPEIDDRFDRGTHSAYQFSTPYDRVITQWLGDQQRQDPRAVSTST